MECAGSSSSSATGESSEAGETTCAGWGRPSSFESLLAVLVVDFSFLFVGQDFEGFGDVLEFPLCIVYVVFISVWMVKHC